MIKENYIKVIDTLALKELAELENSYIRADLDALIKQNLGRWVTSTKIILGMGIASWPVGFFIAEISAFVVTDSLSLGAIPYHIAVIALSGIAAGLFTATTFGLRALYRKVTEYKAEEETKRRIFQDDTLALLIQQRNATVGNKILYKLNPEISDLKKELTEEDAIEIDTGYAMLKLLIEKYETATSAAIATYVLINQLYDFAVAIGADGRVVEPEKISEAKARHIFKNKDHAKEIYGQIIHAALHPKLGPAKTQFLAAMWDHLIHHYLSLQSNPNNKDSVFTQNGISELIKFSWDKIQQENTSKENKWKFLSEIFSVADYSTQKEILKLLTDAIKDPNTKQKAASEIEKIMAKTFLRELDKDDRQKEKISASENLPLLASWKAAPGKNQARSSLSTQNLESIFSFFSNNLLNKQEQNSILLIEEENTSEDKEAKEELKNGKSDDESGYTPQL